MRSGGFDGVRLALSSRFNWPQPVFSDRDDRRHVAGPGVGAIECAGRELDDANARHAAAMQRAGHDSVVTGVRECERDALERRRGLRKDFVGPPESICLQQDFCF
jgi:hypothetical protein